MKNYILISDYLRTKSTESIFPDLKALKNDLSQISELIDKNEAKITILCKQYRVSSSDLKNVLNDYFGHGAIKFTSRGIKKINPRDKIRMEKIENVKVSTENIKIKNVVNWNNVDVMIRNNQAKITKLAQSHNMSATDMRKLLVSHYGDKITFRKGRNGGIRFIN